MTTLQGSLNLFNGMLTMIRGSGPNLDARTDNGPSISGTTINNPAISGHSTRSTGVQGLGQTGVSATILRTLPVVALRARLEPRNAAPGVVDLAGRFDDDVQIHGGLGVSAPAPDGSRRLLHPVLGAEAWLEDVGTGALRNGRAVVKLDADFSALIGTADYCVFVQALGRARSLYVTDRTPSGFEVHEDVLGRSDAPFCWRVVVKRKDTPAARMAKAALATDTP